MLQFTGPVSICVILSSMSDQSVLSAQVELDAPRDAFELPREAPYPQSTASSKRSNERTYRYPLHNPAFVLSFCGVDPNTPEGAAAFAACIKPRPSPKHRINTAPAKRTGIPLFRSATLYNGEALIESSMTADDEEDAESVDLPIWAGTAVITDIDGCSVRSFSLDVDHVGHWDASHFSDTTSEAGGSNIGLFEYAGADEGSSGGASAYSCYGGLNKSRWSTSGEGDSEEDLFDSEEEDVVECEGSPVSGSDSMADSPRTVGEAFWQ